MKNAPAANSNESALYKRNYTPGTRPKLQNTVLADVLALLLEGQALTGMDAVFQQHTTRLSANICTLTRDYGWHIERRKVAKTTKDGRNVYISQYWLAQETINQAYAQGAGTWVTGVHADRAELKQQAMLSKQKAAREKAIRKQLQKQDPRQQSLWGDL